jgi:hypothetical protein
MFTIRDGFQAERGDYDQAFDSSRDEQASFPGLLTRERRGQLTRFTNLSTGGATKSMLSTEYDGSFLNTLIPKIHNFFSL